MQQLWVYKEKISLLVIISSGRTQFQETQPPLSTTHRHQSISSKGLRNFKFRQLLSTAQSLNQSHNQWCLIRTKQWQPISRLNLSMTKTRQLNFSFLHPFSAAQLPAKLSVPPPILQRSISDPTPALLSHSPERNKAKIAQLYYLTISQSRSPTFSATKQL